jgi:hypothetical protein
MVTNVLVYDRFIGHTCKPDSHPNAHFQDYYNKLLITRYVNGHKSYLYTKTADARATNL